jgi:hypothetical protein
MKKLLLISAAVLFAFTSCKKDDDGGGGDPGLTVTQNRQIMMLEYSAAWCPPCGSWGNDAFHDAIDLHGNDVAPMSIHGSSSQPDGMTTATNDILKTNFPLLSGWPNFWVANVSKGTSTNFGSEINQIKSSPIIAQVAFEVTDNPTNYGIDAKVKFFTATQGEYYVSFFALESGIPGHDGAPPGPNGQRMDQAGDNSTDYVHDHVYRGASIDGVFGQKVAEGAIAVDTEVEFMTAIAKEAHWNLANVKIIAFIWEKKKPGAGELQYEYVNANTYGAL